MKDALQVAFYYYCYHAAIFADIFGFSYFANCLAGKFWVG